MGSFGGDADGLGVPPELVGREVSVRVLAPLWHALQAKRVDPERMLAGTGCSLAQLTDTRGRMSWSAFVRFLENVGEVFDDDELVTLGAASLRAPLFRTLLVPGRLLFGVTDVYRWLFGPSGPAGQLFAVHRSTFYEVAPGHLRFETRMKAGYPGSRENYLLLRGSLQGLSEAVGEGPAQVTQQALPDGATFDIVVPSHRGIVGSVRSKIGWVFAAKTAGEELRRAHVELHERYVELQREIEARNRTELERRQLEEQLRQAQKMEAVGRLAGGVAHDFNNLLSVVLSYAGLLIARTQPHEPMRAELEEIQKAGLRAADLTKQLLSFSRQQVINPRVVDLNRIVQDMDGLLRRLIGADVELITHTAPALGYVRADPGQIEQVIMNLVVNARDAMPNGGRLTIETADTLLDAAYASEHLGVTPGPHVMLAVSDTGIGMDKAVQERVFDPFFTTKEKGKGTGLGLSIAFGIARQNGGSLWVYSEPGKGSTFKLYLPRTDRAPSEPAPPAAANAIVSGSETILLVEDEEPLRVVAKEILQASGYRVLDAASGGEALALAAREPGPIELLLTDVTMPRMNGRELAERLVPLRPGLRVLYMSGYTEATVLQRGMLSSEAALLQKPLTPDSLLRRVREALDATGSRERH